MSIRTSPPAPLQDGEGSKNRKIPQRSASTSGIVALQYVGEHKKRQARELRKRATLAERILWSLLRNRKIDGLKFRRQQVIEGFIVDFYCEEAMLVIEVDGSIHDLETQKQKDAHKDAVLVSRGLFVLRLKNECIINEGQKTINEIVFTARKRIGKA